MYYDVFIQGLRVPVRALFLSEKVLYRRDILKCFNIWLKLCQTEGYEGLNVFVYWQT